MTGNDQDNGYSNQDDLPKQLTSMVDSIATNLKTGPIIFGNGDDELESKHPVAVVDYYLSINKTSWAEKTYSDRSYDLTRLLEYCEYADIDDLSELSSADIEGFKEWRKQDENVNLVSLDAQLDNIRVFLRWAENVELVAEGLADEIRMPDLDRSDEVSYVRLSAEQADQIIEHYGQRQYVPREFAELVLAWEALIRLGGIRALDVEDYDREEGYIELRHRPDEGTPLKNQDGNVEGEGGERKINLPDWVCDILNTYLDGTGDPQHPKRIESMDEYGRNPFFSTRQGRVSESTVRRDLYRITQPCRLGQGCPHDQEPEECRARNNNDKLSKCESSVSPHPVRRGGICNQIQRGVDKEIICERADVSLEVLNKHYDLRSKEEARKRRRKELQKVLDGYERGAETSSVQTEVPLIADAISVKNTVTTSLSDDTTQNRLAEGLVAYVCFVLLVAANFILLGFG